MISISSPFAIRWSRPARIRIIGDPELADHEPMDKPSVMPIEAATIINFDTHR